MRLNVDENLPTEAAYDLRDRGHDVETVIQEGLAGRSDKVVLAAARQEQRTLITLGKGVRDDRAGATGEARAPLIGLRRHASRSNAVRTAAVRSVEELSSSEPFATTAVPENTIRVRRSSS